jgi:prevent-host-death family protein
MRRVAIAELKDRASEFVSAAEHGEEIVITRHGKEVARLMPLTGDGQAELDEMFERAARLREEIQVYSGPVTQTEIRQWIEEDRR